MKYIFIAFIFCACNIGSTRNDAATISKEVLDTIQSVPVSTGATPVIFENAFVKGATQRVKEATIGFTGITIGKIKIPSGHIIACDPMHIDEYGKPFTQVFPTGEFPVQLSILELEGEQSIAFARINFSDDPVTRWEFALLEGQPSIPVGGRKKHGYSVDAGVGVFIDEAANKALDQEAVTQMDRGIYKEMETVSVIFYQPKLTTKND